MQLSQWKKWGAIVGLSTVLVTVGLFSYQSMEQRCQDVLHALQWEGPVYRVAAIQSEGTEALCYEIMSYIDERAQQEAEDPEKAE